MTDALRDRVRVAKQLGLHPQLSGGSEFAPLTEGEHYEVVAYTDWADLFVPTVIRWCHGDEVDRLEDADATLANARKALEVSADA